jgi:hypothetical protein
MHVVMDVYCIERNMQISLTAQSVGRKGINRLGGQWYPLRFYGISPKFHR